jgi:hypothetical protein
VSKQGKTFGDKINLSNSTNAQSQNAQIDTFGDNDSNVIVTWWERNATSNEPVARISTDSGKTFGVLRPLRDESYFALCSKLLFLPTI